MKTPASAADAKPEATASPDEIMVIVQDQHFMMSVVDAISLAGTINAIVAGKMRNDNRT